MYQDSGSVIICTDPDPSITKRKSLKNLDFKNLVYLQKVISINTYFFVGTLSTTDKRQDPDLDQWYGSADPESGSVPKCQGSTTLKIGTGTLGSTCTTISSLSTVIS